ncbi:hypothetical protein GCK72_023174 [Caenorhabditis remanei]|uniref:Uncharacterized protein n=1 Tax=Caenorhabditis remanei TaxID=31234 RepID=A0A6A5FW32_CAERE|nr:hypothetical protein GCK72_023174 [Caenorhabditis remanei]KAF1746717.1 hypothetical protein GCK72_023174 [Caenorhabditis remanei]
MLLTSSPPMSPPVPLEENPAKPSQAFVRFLMVFLIILMGSQYTYGVFVHSAFLSMQFAGSALLFLSAAESYWWIVFAKKSNHQGIRLLSRTAGTIFYIACLFLNLTHCLEDISDINDSGHTEHSNETTEALTDSAGTIGALFEEAGHGHGINSLILCGSVVDLAIKTAFAFSYNSLSIHFFGNFFVMVSPPLLTLAVYAHQLREVDLFGDWLEDHLEPSATIVLTVMCISISFWSLSKKKQFLLAEGPKNFEIDKISKAVKSKNDRLEKVDHVHASCEWPEGFTVSLKAYIKVEKSKKDWVSRAADDYSQLKSLLHQEIKSQGAKEVIVEPVFVDQREMTDFVDPICISPSCHNENVGCCTIPKPVGEA